MPKPSESVTAYGGKAERFREVKEEIEEVRGWEPSNSEVLAVLLGEFDSDSYRRSR